MSDTASIMPEHPPVLDWIHDFDHTDPRWTDNPYPIWEQLRSASPPYATLLKSLIQSWSSFHPTM